MEELDGLAYQSLQSLLNNNEEYQLYKNQYQLVRLHKFVTVAVFPNDDLNNKITYIYVDWASNNGDGNYDIRAVEGHKEVFNDSKNIVKRTFKVWYLDLYSNPRITQNVDVVDWPGVIYFYQEGVMDLKAKIILRMTFMKKRNAFLTYGDFIKGKKMIRQQYREKIIDKISDISSEISSIRSQSILEEDDVAELLKENKTFNEVFKEGFVMCQDFLLDFEKFIRRNIKNRDDLDKWIEVVKILRRCRMDHEEMQIFKRIKNLIYALKRELQLVDKIEDVEFTTIKEDKKNKLKEEKKQKEKELALVKIENKKIANEIRMKELDKKTRNLELQEGIMQMKKDYLNTQKDLIEKNMYLKNDSVAAQKERRLQDMQRRVYKLSDKLHEKKEQNKKLIEKQKKQNLFYNLYGDAQVRDLKKMEHDWEKIWPRIPTQFGSRLDDCGDCPDEIKRMKQYRAEEIMKIAKHYDKISGRTRNLKEKINDDKYSYEDFKRELDKYKSDLPDYYNDINDIYADVDKP